MVVTTIWISLALLILGYLAKLTSRKPPEEINYLARWSWTLGCLFYLAHVIAAFHLVHEWSHSAAVEHTALQSERVVGWRFGAGIWFNHLFSLLVTVETVWWWVSPFSFRNRKAWLEVAIYGYLAFIALNGAVIFRGS